MKLRDSIEKAAPPEGAIACWWLAQAGFVFKTAGRQIAHVDPYLSDCVERIAGFRRLSPAPIAAEEVCADWVISTHEHPDHLDVDALSVIAGNNPRCRFAGPSGCLEAYRQCALPEERLLILDAGRIYDLGGARLHTAQADHGALSESALSLLLDFGGVRVLCTGDTGFNIEYLRPLLDRKPDLVLPCINGSYGNLNAREAAQVVSMSGARAAIPCHYGMFKEHHTVEGGDPETFVRCCAELCPAAAVRVLSPGRGVLISPGSITDLL